MYAVYQVAEKRILWKNDACVYKPKKTSTVAFSRICQKRDFTDL